MPIQVDTQPVDIMDVEYNSPSPATLATTPGNARKRKAVKTKYVAPQMSLHTQLTFTFIYPFIPLYIGGLTWFLFIWGCEFEFSDTGALYSLAV